VIQVGAEQPDVELDHMLVDNAAMQLVSRPADFDVIVTENLFGDILSDEAAAIAGSLGLLPSASIGARGTAHGRFGLYEPVHGSAPQLAGLGAANPLAAVASAGMMLRFSLGELDAAATLDAAVDAAIAAGPRTPDLGGRESTESVARFLLGRLGEHAGVAA
jgi:3-isopropylmalate dehydrogenase